MDATSIKQHRTMVVAAAQLKAKFLWKLRGRRWRHRSAITEVFYGHQWQSRGVAL
jgi:hypothetical protein